VAIFMTGLAWTLAMVTQTQAASKGTDALSGLWGVEASFGSQVSGELTVDGRCTPWRGTLAGYDVNVTVAEDRLGFKLPQDRGEFRGKLDRAAGVIHGQWIQPPGEILQRAYATPVELRALSPSVFRGSVLPLEQRISVYALITAGADGAVTAVLVNPEMNFFRKRVFAVTRHENEVLLEAKGWSIKGSYDEKAEALSLQLVDFLQPFRFSRRAKDAVGFYPRTPGGDAYHYRVPVAQGDGWTTAALSQEGLDERPIRELIERILGAEPASSALSIHSLLIARHGKLVLEEYFRGFDAQRPHDMRSASKTFAPVLVGLARERGIQLGPQTPVYPLFSRYSALASGDVRRQAMTLRDIMTMTAGNACDDNDDSSPGNEDRMQATAPDGDWYRYALELPMLKPPGGESAVYCSADLNLVGGAVASATAEWLPEFFAERLARPLQFGRYYLNLMPDGEAYMGGGAYLLPRDELKLGQLFLDTGTWHGKRILSRQWVEESLSTHAKFDPRYSLGQEHGYGYGWHINDLASGGVKYRAVAAGGNGGQFVVVIPSLDLVVGINGGAYGEFDRWYVWELELIPRFIIPAAASPSSH
jgi:CubicO group peptidase (beta-lactamase class C family)